MEPNTLISTLQAHYLQIKFIHLVAAMIWLWSTSVAYLDYLLPVMRKWQQNPANPALIKERNRAMERFDDGARLEHIAFPLLLLSGLTLLLISGWGPDAFWLALKLTLVILVFLPIECCDYYLAHMGGNKAGIRRLASAESPRYETAIQQHWWFLVLSTPVIVISGLTVVYLAVVKPM